MRWGCSTASQQVLLAGDFFDVTYVIYCSERAVWSSYFAASISEAFKSLLLPCKRLSRFR